MKKIIFLLASIFICISLQSQDMHIYNKSGEKIYFQKVDSIKFIHFDKQTE